MEERYRPIQATLCYLRKEGKVLFIQRGGGLADIHDGFFVVPGGHTKSSRLEKKCELGSECVLREFKEETGLTLRGLKLRAIVTFFNLGRKFGDAFDPEDYKVEVYEAKDYLGELNSASDSSKNKRAVWVEDAEVSGLNMWEGDKRIYDLITKNPQGVFEILVKYKEGDKLEEFRIEKVAN